MMRVVRGTVRPLKKIAKKNNTGTVGIFSEEWIPIGAVVTKIFSLK